MTLPADTSDTSDTTPQFPLRDLLGMHIEQGEGEAWATLEIGEIHINPHGSLHGAVPFLMLDTVMGAATKTVIGEGNWCSTVDIHIRYFAPSFSGRLRAHARCARPGSGSSTSTVRSPPTTGPRSAPRSACSR